MKRTLFRFFARAVMIAGILPMTGLAQGNRCRRNDNINEREYSQRNRIRDGVRSGELTRGKQIDSFISSAESNPMNVAHGWTMADWIGKSAGALIGC